MEKFYSTNNTMVAVRSIASNVLRLGEGCLTDVQFSQQTLMAAFAKPLLCVCVAVI